MRKSKYKIKRVRKGRSMYKIGKKTKEMNSFFAAQFNYCPLIWMIHSRFNNNKAKHLHERCIRPI